MLTANNITGDNTAKIAIRVPGWVNSGKIAAEGRTIELTKKCAGTYIIVDISDLASAEIVIDFDMPVRLTTAHPLVEECVNQVAVERGPLVYCIETPDVETETLDSLLISPSTQFTPVSYQIKTAWLLRLNVNYCARKKLLQANCMRHLNLMVLTRSKQDSYHILHGITEVQKTTEHMMFMQSKTN